MMIRGVTGKRDTIMWKLAGTEQPHPTRPKEGQHRIGRTSVRMQDVRNRRAGPAPKASVSAQENVRTSRPIIGRGGAAGSLEYIPSKAMTALLSLCLSQSAHFTDSDSCFAMHDIMVLFCERTGALCYKADESADESKK
jgi:hypothetical protein